MGKLLLKLVSSMLGWNSGVSVDVLGIGIGNLVDRVYMHILCAVYIQLTLSSCFVRLSFREERYYNHY